MATETLSEYLERDITSECLSDIKQKVQDKYRYVIHLLLFQTFPRVRKGDKGVQDNTRAHIGRPLTFLWD